MLALDVVLLVTVVLLGCLVLGLLRSHADILRALHRLGVGVGDPAPEPAGSQPIALVDRQVPPQPPLPAERSSAVHDITGTTPGGDPVTISVSNHPLVLLMFLSSGCSTCGAIWAGLSDPTSRRLLPRDARVVVVTKGAEWESSAAVAAREPIDTAVVMSTEAWGNYEIPGSPYLVLVDGTSRTRLGEGVPQTVSQASEMIRRAGADDALVESHRSRSPAAAAGMNGAEREAHNDEVLRSAGILPGDPSLYRRDLGKAFATTAPETPSPESSDAEDQR
jgi:hypothetical protein